MHDEKIWSLEHTDQGFLISGGGDSSVKIWRDCTVEKEAEEKEKEFQRYSFFVFLCVLLDCKTR